jgi:starch synthase
MGETVDVILPKYDFIDVRKISHLKMEVPDFKCLENGNLHANAMWSGTCEDCSVHLLEARHPAGYFHRGKIYNCDDDAARFLYFSRACLEYLKLKKEPIDILHLHDWHTAIAAVLTKEIFQLPIRGIILTIHNAEYQGPCAPWDLDAIGLKGADYLTKEKLQDDDPARPKTINLLKGGIVYSDAVNTVSPSYAKEILTSDLGIHLDATLRKYKEKVSGILNGIDAKIWDPGSDPALQTPYTAESSISAILEAKKSARAVLKSRFNLSEDRRPWVGSVVRLVPEKGPDLIEAGIRQTLKQGGSFVFLGSSPLPKLQTHFDQLKKTLPQALFHFEYDEALAHQVFAALDFLLAPSLKEPCGLTQLIAMRYGTVPIVRATGGLKDTVFDCEDPSIPIQKRNGFVFQKPSSAAETVERAIRFFRSDAATLQSMLRRSMQTDFSWKIPAQNYSRLYRSLLERKKSHPATPSRALF